MLNESVLVSLEPLKVPTICQSFAATGVDAGVGAGVDSGVGVGVGGVTGAGVGVGAAFFGATVVFGVGVGVVTAAGVVGVESTGTICSCAGATATGSFLLDDPREPMNRPSARTITTATIFPAPVERNFLMSSIYYFARAVADPSG